MKVFKPTEPDPEWMTLAEYIERHFGEVVHMWKATGALNDGLEKATNYFPKLQAIRKYYLTIEADILAQHRNCPYVYYDSYPTDWSRLFTHIERQAWGCIRTKGRIVLYPQYPVLNYHLDFANPALKIALELDGKMHDRERDFIRDAELKREGWTVYRVSGTEMMRTNYKEWYDMEIDPDATEEDHLENLRYWILQTGDGVIQAIKERYFDELGHATITPYLGEMYRQYCYDTLELHKLI